MTTKFNSMKFISGGVIALALIFAGSVNAQSASTTATTTSTTSTTTSPTSTSSVMGCVNTTGYSTTTGQLCNGSGSPSTQMSTTTNTSITGTFPIGCSSYNGYSPFSGESCMSMLYTTTVTPVVVIPVSVTSNIPLCEITRSLKTGSTGEDVRCLQKFLNYSGYTVSTSGSGAPGSESTYFGPATASAVTRWQNANASQVLTPFNLSSGTGLFGSGSFNYYVTLVVNALRSMSTTTR